MTERLTPKQFEEKKILLRNLAMTSIDLARLVLVDGLSPKEAGDTLGLSKANVSQILKRVRSLLTGYPADWELVEEWMPRELAKEVRMRALAAKLDLEKKS